MNFKNTPIILAFCCLAATGFAQQTARPDTSFNFNSAFKGVLKANPSASIPVLNLGDSVKATENVTYCIINGRRLLLDVFMPAAKSKTKLPAVLLIFGGGWRSGNRSMHIPMAKEIAAKGYVTITVDYRLSTEAIYPAAVNDLKTAIKWMRANAKKYNIDTDKIATWGFSAGGQLATLVGTTANNDLFKGNDVYHKYSDAVQGIIDVDGTLAFIHPESGEGDDSKSTSAATYWFGGPKTQHPELWHQAGALNHVDKHTPPILFLNSSVARMHAGRDDMIAKMDSLHIYHEMHAFADAPHSFNMFNPWFWPTVNYTVTFLDKIFKGK